jgi:hypothetical protein
MCAADGSDSGSSTYVVDPNFRDSFVVAHPTPRYSAVLEGVDQEVVATQVGLVAGGRDCVVGWGGGGGGECVLAVLAGRLVDVGAQAWPLGASGSASCTGLSVVFAATRRSMGLSLSGWAAAALRGLTSPPSCSALVQACLRRAVTILSRELARSFTEQGSPVPPWRTQQALLSKWSLQHQAGGGCGQLALGAWAPVAGTLEGPGAFGRVS